MTGIDPQSGEEHNENMDQDEYKPVDLERLRITIAVAVKTRVPKHLKLGYAKGRPHETDAGAEAITQAVMECLRGLRLLEKPHRAPGGYFPDVQTDD